MVLNHFKPTNISFLISVVTAIPLHLEIPNIKESVFCPEAEVVVREKTKRDQNEIHDGIWLLRIIEELSIAI